MKPSSIKSFAKLRTPLLVALGVTYLGFHVMHGERGVYALFKETHRQSLLEKELAEMTAQREHTELKVSHLRNDSLDLDLLDQQAREMLGLMGEGEKLVLIQNQ